MVQTKLQLVDVLPSTHFSFFHKLRGMKDIIIHVQVTSYISFYFSGRQDISSTLIYVQSFLTDIHHRIH